MDPIFTPAKEMILAGLSARLSTFEHTAKTTSQSLSFSEMPPRVAEVQADSRLQKDVEVMLTASIGKQFKSTAASADKYVENYYMKRSANASHLQGKLQDERQRLNAIPN